MSPALHSLTPKERAAALERAKAQFALNLETYLRRQVQESENWPKTLAELTGIGVTSAQRYLDPAREDYSYPKLDQLIAIAEGLKISVSQLLRGVSPSSGGISGDRQWADLDSPVRFDA